MADERNEDSETRPLLSGGRNLEAGFPASADAQSCTERVFSGLGKVARYVGDNAEIAAKHAGPYKAATLSGIWAGLTGKFEGTILNFLMSPAYWLVFAGEEYLTAVGKINEAIQKKDGKALLGALSAASGGTGAVNVAFGGGSFEGTLFAPYCFTAAFTFALAADSVNLKKAIQEKKWDVVAQHIFNGLTHVMQLTGVVMGLGVINDIDQKAGGDGNVISKGAAETSLFVALAGATADFVDKGIVKPNPVEWKKLYNTITCKPATEADRVDDADLDDAKGRGRAFSPSGSGDE